MTRYFMRPKTYNRFKTMGYSLVCKICEKDIKHYDEAESKASGKGPKLYHAECYDEYHLDFEYTEEALKKILEEEGREGLVVVVWEFNEDAPEGLSDEELIDHILTLEAEWIKRERNI